MLSCVDRQTETSMSLSPRHVVETLRFTRFVGFLVDFPSPSLQIACISVHLLSPWIRINYRLSRRRARRFLEVPCLQFCQIQRKLYACREVRVQDDSHYYFHWRKRLKGTKIRLLEFFWFSFSEVKKFSFSCVYHFTVFLGHYKLIMQKNCKTP